MAGSKYVILGGGMAAGYAAKELAERGLKSGELCIVSSDDALPYERPPLSKGFLAGKENEAGILINKPEWYAERGIEVRLRTVAESIDAAGKRLRTNSGETFAFEELLIATGARARKLDCPGGELANIFYLRSMDDSRAIREAASTAKQAVVIGGGFIGMEVASVLAQQKIETTMVIQEDRVWSRVFTPEMSAFFERYYAARGVRIRKQQRVAEIRGKERVAAVVLGGGEPLGCDMVVAGIGVVPVTDLAGRAGLAVENGIVVDEFLATSHPGISAAGDVANYTDTIFGKRRRVEHWDNAVSQGQHWSARVTGDRKPFAHVPYFFSDVFDLSYELWGDASGATQVVTRGDMHSPSFSVWWLKREQVVSAFVMSRPEEEREAAQEWIRSGQSVSAERLQDQKRPVNDAASSAHARGSRP
ncbi:MAG TPA: FAD-dependent oxidoreductase [Candidatus Acidoferrum sp.]|nr:FAD-dependent oxidoreductase [Candidatus Acidoferrum sp.]